MLVYRGFFNVDLLVLATETVVGEGFPAGCVASVGLVLTYADDESGDVEEVKWMAKICYDDGVVCEDCCNVVSSEGVRVMFSGRPDVLRKIDDLTDEFVWGKISEANELFGWGWTMDEIKSWTRLSF